jgi:SAM-dependent methyltransferase
LTIQKINFDLPPAGTLTANHAADDPLPYYYRPFVGWFYRRRIETGLELLTPPYARVLEVGYGSGILLPTLAQLGRELHGVDLASDPAVVGARLERVGVKAHLVKASLCEWQEARDQFDLVVAFSVLEHIPDPAAALAAIARVLRPGGSLLVGMPRVDRFMTALFPMIGYQNIDSHHVTSHRDVRRAAEPYFRLMRAKCFPWLLPGWACLYHNLLFRKRDDAGRP